MSSGLMSCVRENSPPLETKADGGGREATSLPASPASTPTNSGDTQKRRRFNPLRNLRRIFRRRTLNNSNSDASAPPSASTSPTPAVAVPHPLASTPSPATHITATVPADTSTTTEHSPASSMSSTAVQVMLARNCGNGLVPMGGRNCRKEKLKGGDSASDLDDSREMTDSQRSFSEGRLVDSEFNRDSLSHSHDSVFSESATASSLSIVLKAELADVLRKRRNRPDASDEDLGLPRSPITPQRRANTIHNANQSEVSSLSLLSMVSSELDDESGLMSGVSSKDTSRTSDEIDLGVATGTRLSHSAARHKMAVRPKKKGPTRYRKPIETTALPSTPEVNEEVLRPNLLDVKDLSDKMKTRSLPPGVNAKMLEEHSTTETASKTVVIKRSKTLRSTQTQEEFTSGDFSNEDESGFFRRFLNRGSKRVTKSGKDECDVPADASDPNKPKSGPAARQRFIPKDLSPSPLPVVKTLQSEDVFQSTLLVKEVARKEHFEKNQPRIIGLSPFQQKISRSNDSITSSTDCDQDIVAQKQRKSVEKSKSFRSYAETESSGGLKPNMPSLPDLTFARHFAISNTTTTSSTDDLKSEDLSLGFEINDNNLIKEKPEPLPLSQGIYTKNIILTTSKAASTTCNTNISEIEDSIDQLVKSPFVSVLRKSQIFPDSGETTAKLPVNISISPMATKSFDMFERKERFGMRHSESTRSVNELVSKIGLAKDRKSLTDLTKLSTEAKVTNKARRSSSVIETDNAGVPEFMKIQLHRVDPIRPKSNIVLAKNFKESSEEIIQPKSPQTPQTSPVRKLFEETEKKAFVVKPQSPLFEKEITLAQLSEENKLFEDTDKKAFTPKTPQSPLGKLFEDFDRKAFAPKTPKSPIVKLFDEKKLFEDSVKKAFVAKRPDEREKSPVQKLVEEKPLEKNAKSPVAKPSVAKRPEERNNGVEKKLFEEKRFSDETEIRRKEENVIFRTSSLQEKRMLFNEETVCSLRERKKLFNEETKTERKSSKILVEETRTERKSSVEEETGVILRKKSFTMANNNNKDDPTPELMKVFARRSLKIKDEDLPPLGDSKQPPSVDSDKENHSSSEEKLDKLPKVEITVQPGQNDLTKGRSSLTDFRNKPPANNNNGIIASATSRPSNGYRQTASIFAKSLSMNDNMSSASNNNNNNNSSSNNNNHVLFKASARHTIGASTLETQTAQNQSEFKGIHQRRAEWEKRAKEALK